MEFQHLNVKLLVKEPERVNLEPVIPVFHNWIEGQVFDELLLDVADYRHVEAGPGVVLIGHEANYSVDNTDARLGVRYNRKAPMDGSNEERLRHATRAALAAFQRLESESGLDGTLQFDGQNMEFFLNDRLLSPNTEATRETLRPEFEKFLEKLFGGREYSVRYPNDPRRLFGFSVKTSQVFSTEDLLANLSA